MSEYQIVETSSSSRMTVIDLDSKLLQEGIIEINDEFNADTVSDWRNALLYLKSKFSVADTQKNPIQLHINSPGGEVYSTLGLIATMRKMQEEGYVISTVNVGLAASAACWTLMAGTPGYRKSLRYCRTMAHTLSSGTYGKIADLIVDVEESKNLQKVLDQLTSEMACSELVEKSKYLDFWMSPEEAVKYHVIDSVI